MLALSPDVVLFLGASLPTPAGGPLFAQVQDACTETRRCQDPGLARGRPQAQGHL